VIAANQTLAYARQIWWDGGIIMRNFIRFLVAATLFSAFLSSTAVAEPGIRHNGLFAWLAISQSECVARASAALAALAQQNGIAAQPQSYDGWLVSLATPGDANGEDFVYSVQCIADDETENIVNPSVNRMLVAHVVMTTRQLDVTSMRAFVHQCMQTGACGPQPDVSVDLSGNWYGDGWGDVVIWRDGDGYLGTYSDTMGMGGVGNFSLRPDLTGDWWQTGHSGTMSVQIVDANTLNVPFAGSAGSGTSTLTRR
jgi:hypothetical protein